VWRQTDGMGGEIVNRDAGIISADEAIGRYGWYLVNKTSINANKRTIKISNANAGGGDVPVLDGPFPGDLSFSRIILSSVVEVTDRSTYR
jgi:hypothetical protein